MTTLASLLALSIFVFLAWVVSRLKEPPAFAFVSLTVFGAVPILLMLKTEIANYAVETPEGKWVVRVQALEKQVETVRTTTTNISATVATASSEEQGRSVSGMASTPLRYLRITDIGPDDAWYSERNALIGEIGTAADLPVWPDGWSYGTIKLLKQGADETTEMIFHQFKYVDVAKPVKAVN